MMKKILVYTLILGVSFLSLAPTMAKENDNKGKGKEKKVEVERDHASTSTPAAVKFVSKTLTLKGTLVSAPSTTMPAQFTLKLDKISPKKPKKWANVYPETDKDLVVLVNSSTRMLRAYGAKLALGDMSVGDKIELVGRLNEDGTVTAKLVKDNSIHKQLLKTGVVVSINASDLSFTMKRKDATWTVKTDSATKFSLPRATSTSFADLKVGDKLYVNGVVNSNTKIAQAARVQILKRPEVQPAPVATSTTP